MSCSFYVEKNGRNYCTAKGGYIDDYCPAEDKKCCFYPKEKHVEEGVCRYWHEGNYCALKGDFRSKECINGYRDCRSFNGGNDKSDDKRCYLTTTCVYYKGMSDDCIELQILRDYRDNYLKTFEEGRKDVYEYYDVAPDIIKAIGLQPDAKEIWEDIYTNLVCKCVELIKEEKYPEAHSHYKNFVIKLLKYMR